MSRLSWHMKFSSLIFLIWPDVPTPGAGCNTCSDQHIPSMNAFCAAQPKLQCWIAQRHCAASFIYNCNYIYHIVCISTPRHACVPICKSALDIASGNLRLEPQHMHFDSRHNIALLAKSCNCGSNAADTDASALPGYIWGAEPLQMVSDPSCCHLIEYDASCWEVQPDLGQVLPSCLTPRRPENYPAGACGCRRSPEIGCLSHD